MLVALFVDCMSFKDENNLHKDFLNSSNDLSFGGITKITLTVSSENPLGAGFFFLQLIL